MARIGIIGNGVVGGALRRWLIRHTKNDVFVYDPPQGHDGEIPNVDVAFISVPVPTKSFKLDFTILHQAINAVKDKADLICIRSSVLPGTVDALAEQYNRQIIAMPEFLTERKRDEDVARQDVIAGVPEKYDDPIERDYLHRVLDRVFEGKKKIMISTAKNCEMTKYTHNVFGALKVTYFNGIYRQCQKHGIDFEEVREMMQVSGMIVPQHSRVPGPDGKLGYGGHCFPKDAAAFLGFLGSDCEHMLIKDMICLNRFYRGDKDLPVELLIDDSPKQAVDLQDIQKRDSI